jgi:hypothetical protein
MIPQSAPERKWGMGRNLKIVPGLENPNLVRGKDSLAAWKTPSQ